MKSLGLLLGFVMAFSFAQAADKAKDKRAVASPPIPAMGMPMHPSSGGTGIPPGAVGMPLPVDSTCRRTVGMAAVNDALENAEHGEDCLAQEISVVQPFKQYRVKVICTKGEEEGEETTYIVKARMKSKKNRTCRTVSVDEVESK